MLTILKQMIVFFILVLLGFSLFKKDIIDNNIIQKISILVVDICNPALAFSCIIQNKIHVSHEQLLSAGIIGIIIYFLLILLGIFLPKLMKIQKENQKYYQMMTTYTNTGFIGIPLAKAILPSRSMIYVIIFNVLFNIFFYSHGIFVMQNKRSTSETPERKKINIGLLSGLFTIFICWSQLQIPKILEDTIIYIGNATTFLSMMLLGASFATIPFTKVFKGKKIYIYSLLHLVVIPLTVGLILKIAEIDSCIINAYVLMIAMPMANLPLILARKNHEDTSLLTQMILLTTILSLISVPMVMGVII